MGYIYCITNIINNKKYVGKTVSTIEKRWKEHCHDSKKLKLEKRPLYTAFTKYGIENFKIQELEFVEDDTKISEREVYWISKLNTYGKYGYNATKGGDGKIVYDHNRILKLYNQGYSSIKIHLELGCDRTTVLNVLRANGFKSRGRSKRIEQLDLDGNYIQTFDSIKEAGTWLIEQGVTSFINCHKAIYQVCINNRKNAYGFRWVYKNTL